MNDTNQPAGALVQRLHGEKVGHQVLPDGLERDLYRIPDPA